MLAANALLILASFSAVEAPQLYYFTSENCPACHQVAPTIAELKGQGVPIIHVDANQRREWTEQAQVKVLPTFIAVAAGQEVGRLTGVVSFRELSQLYFQAVRQLADAQSSPDQRNPKATGQPKLAVSDSAPAPIPEPTYLDESSRTRPPANRPSGFANHDAANDTGDAETVRGQDPHQGRSGSRLSRAFNGLTGRQTTSCTHCIGTCHCSPGKAGASAVLPVGHEVVVESPSQACIADALAATVRLKVVDELGQSFGTGTIIDVHKDEALVLTCGHIFRESEGKGRVLCDSFATDAKHGIEGKLISYNIRRDVGLVSFRPNVPVKPVKVAGTGQRPKDNDQVFSIGCNQGDRPTVMKNRVIAVNRYHGPPNIVVGGRPVDGRSGGGLFTVDGQLLGVCNAADPEYDEGLYAAIGNVHAELDAVGLGFIYRKQQPEIALGEKRTPTRPSLSRQHDDVAPNVGEELQDDQILPVSTTTEGELQEDANAEGSPMANRVQTAQLIASIRNPENPNAPVKLFIERPSRALLEQLSREANSRGPHRQTQLQIDRGGRAAEEGWHSLAP